MEDTALVSMCRIAAAGGQMWCGYFPQLRWLHSRCFRGNWGDLKSPNRREYTYFVHAGTLASDRHELLRAHSDM